VHEETEETAGTNERAVEQMNALRAFQHRSDAPTPCSSLLSTTTTHHHTTHLISQSSVYFIRSAHEHRLEGGHRVRTCTSDKGTDRGVVKGNSLVLFTAARSTCATLSLCV